MKKILPFVIVIGVVSLVACAGLGSCADGSRVLAQDENRLMIENPRRANYPSDPWCLGAFDYVDWANQRVVRCTKYLDIMDADPSDWVVENDVNAVRAYMTNDYAATFGFDRVNIWNGQTSQRGFGTISGGKWWNSLDLNNLPTDSIYGLFWGGGGGLTISIPLTLLADNTLQSFCEYIDSNHFHISYASSTVTYEPLGEAANGENMSEAYSEGYSEGLENYDVPITIHFDTYTGQNLPQPLAFEINWWEDEYTYLYRDGTSFTLPEHIFGPSFPYMGLRLSIISTQPHFRHNLGLELNISTYLSGDCAFDVSSGHDEDQPLYLPYFEGAIDIYVTLVPDETTGYCYSDPYYDGDIYFQIDTVEPATVNVGGLWGDAFFDGQEAVQSDIYEAGRSDGYSVGYGEGYSEGDSHGYRVGYNEGEAAVGEGGLVVANLFGAIAGVPITVLNGLSGLTIWSIPLISVLMSFMFLGIVIWVVKKFI